MRGNLDKISEGLLQRRINEKSTTLYLDFMEAWKSASKHEERLNAIMDLLHELENSGGTLSRDEKSGMFRYFDKVVLGTIPSTQSEVNQMLNRGDKLKLISAKDMEKLVRDFRTAKTFNK